MNSGRPIRVDRTEPLAPELDRTNVVPFARRAEAPARGAPEVLVTSADRPVELIARRRARLMVLIVCSAAAHAALYLPFARDPEPMASLGEMVISAEIVIGANAPAGPANEQGQAQASAPEPAKTPEPVVDPPDPVLAQSEPPRPEAAPTQSEPPKSEAAAAEPPPDTQPAPTEPTQVARLPEPVAQPEPTQVAAPPEPAEQPKPTEPTQVAAPAEPLAQPEPTAPTRMTALPEPVEQPAPTEPTHITARPEPVEQPSVEPPVPAEQVAPPKPKAAPALPPPNPAPPKQVAKPAPKKPDKPKPDTRRASLAGAPNDARSTAPPATSAAGAGPGRSDAGSNYAGVVAAHLARFKQFPSDARSRGDQGRASVTFSLNGGGSVTAVRLARGTGVASLDAEATAMVRRASPFPAPPHGRPVSFTVPVSFRLN